MLKDREFPFAHLVALAGSDAAGRKLGKFLMDVWARDKDSESKNKLLRGLILRYADVEKRMKILNDELQIRQRALLDDLASAAAIQKTLLPVRLPESDEIEAAFEFLPCEQVGGDLVSLVRYDDDNWLAYVLDVAGHGTRAAMITVSVAQFLQVSSGLPFLSPAQIMKALDREFPFSRFNSFFTIIYGVVNLKRKTFTYCNSGHPNPVLLQPGRPPCFVEGAGPMLGLGLSVPWPEVTVDLSCGRSMILYTDGLVECINDSGKLFGEDRLKEMLNRLQFQSAGCLARTIMTEMNEFMGKVKFQDDFTLLTLKSRN